MRTFAIVGANLAGAWTAITLRQEGFDGRLLLIGAEPDPPYERPALSKTFLRGETPFEKTLVTPAEFYRENNVELRLGVRVTRVDVAAHRLDTDLGEPISYDALLIATGGRNCRLRVPGIDLEGIYDLRTREDADRIRLEIGSGRRALVVGLGFTGSEVAASLRMSGVDVVAIELTATPLTRVLGEQVGSALSRMHEQRGVQTIFQDRVVRFEGTGGRVTHAVTAAGRHIDCDFAVVAVGVEPATDIVADTPVKVDNGIVVDEMCRTSVEGIFAAGDVANHFHPLFGRHLRVEHWQNAIKQGAAAARSMLGKGKAYDEVHWFWSDQYDSTIQYAGFHTTWEQLVVRGSLEGPDFIAFYMNSGCIQAAVALNRPKDLRATIPLIKRQTVVNIDALRDPSTELKTLAAAAGR